jgi:mono/diheme cytochrome c family protein
MHRNSRIVLIILFIAAVGATSISLWLLPARQQSIGLFLPDNREYVSLGKRIYRESCASCHGANLEGQVADWRTPAPDGRLPAPPHNEEGHTWHHNDQILFNITKLGVAKAANLKNYNSAMPAYEEILSDKEIIAVFSYIKSTWPEELRNRHDELNRQTQDSK